MKGVNVAGADAKVTGQRKDIGVSEGSKRVTVFDEGIAGGGGGGGVLHFFVPLFVFVFALSLEDTYILPQPDSVVKLRNCKVGTKITAKRIVKNILSSLFHIYRLPRA